VFAQLLAPENEALKPALGCGGFILLHTVFQTRALGMLMLLNLAHHIELEQDSTGSSAALTIWGSRA
jgi:hypothetical protein